MPHFNLQAHSYLQYPTFVRESPIFSVFNRAQNTVFWESFFSLYIAHLRSLGLRLLIYMHIDDILLMAETETMAKEHTAALLFLLENLGFIINFPKSPHKHLGVSINTYTNGVLYSSLQQHVQCIIMAVATGN